MREELSKIQNIRMQFAAKVERFGIKSNYHGFPEKTICLVDVTDTNGKVLTDHIWFTVGKTIDKLNLNEGDEVSFFARVSQYRNGYFKDELDYKLNNISQIKRL